MARCSFILSLTRWKYLRMSPAGPMKLPLFRYLGRAYSYFVRIESVKKPKMLSGKGLFGSSRQWRSDSELRGA